MRFGSIIVFLPLLVTPRHYDLRTVAGLAFDPQLGANCLRALAHDAQPQVIWRHSIHVKATTVVFNK
jgi:hypothetical protein